MHRHENQSKLSVVYGPRDDDEELGSVTAATTDHLHRQLRRMNCSQEFKIKDKYSNRYLMMASDFNVRHENWDSGNADAFKWRIKRVDGEGIELTNVGLDFTIWASDISGDGARKSRRGKIAYKATAGGCWTTRD